jgi:WD40 repeat protein
VLGVSWNVAGALVVPLWRATLLDCVSALAAQPRGELLAAASLGGTVALYALSSGRLVARLASHPGGALSLAWAPDGRIVASGGQDGMVHLARADGAMIASLDVGKGRVAHLAWNDDGDVLASAAGRSVRFWSRRGEPLGEIIGHVATVSALVARPRAGGFLSACHGELKLLTVGRPEPIRRLVYEASVECVAVAHNEKWIVAGSQNAAMRVWRGNGQKLYMSGFPSQVVGCGFSFDAHWLWSTAGAAVCVWPFSGKGPAGRKPIHMLGHEGTVTTAAWVPGRAVQTLLSGATDGTVRVWRLPDGAPFGLGEVGEPVERVAVSADGRFAAAGGRGGIVSGWALG